jgi:hypothetical protein
MLWGPRKPGHACVDIGFDCPDNENEQKLLRAYLKQLCSEFKLLPPLSSPSDEQKEALSRASAICDKVIGSAQAAPPTQGGAPHDGWLWSEAYELERCVVRLEPPERLCMRLPLLRDEYAAIAGTAAYKVYADSGPPNPAAYDIKKPDPELEKLLRADALRLLGELHWLYMAITAEDRELRDIAGKFGTVRWWSIATFGLLYAALYGVEVVARYDHALPFPTAPVAALCGALGGYMSARQRLESVSVEGNQIANLFEIDRRYLAVTTAIFAGAVFGLVFYAILVGGLVTGLLFPKFEPVSVEPCPLKQPLGWIVDLAVGIAPESAVDYAKTFVWAFIAGFAERMVPDILGTLGAGAAKGSSK